MSERKMATIRRIDAINPIENADAIEVATVGGWKVVCQKGLYKAGDLVVYCEIDSWIPTEVAPFLSKGQEPHEYNGVKGERLRTVRLRGQISQGLLLPFSEIIETWDDGVLLSNEDLYNEGEDVSEILGIQKYEPPIPACLAGEVKGLFPSFIPKTDEERCLSGDTLIEVEDNKFRTIQNICENKIICKVKSYNVATQSVEWKSITDFSIMRGSTDWYEIITKNGKKLKATGNHRVWCDDIKSYRLVSDLSIGQRVIIIDEVISITQIECDSKRYDITVEDNHNFFANDILVHNCQNLANEWDELKKLDPWFITEKVDGTSFTCYIKGDTFGVCSRNLELRENDSNTYWKVAKENDLETKMRKIRSEHGNVDFAIQSEILGEGIQKNKYNLKGQKMFVFNAYNITDGAFFSQDAVFDICKELGIETVPVLGEHLHFEPDDTIDSILKFAEGTSLLNPNTEREGVVFKTYAREKSFKAISNKFLIKNGE